MSGGMNISQYSRHRGVSRAAVRKAIECGRITAGPDGKIDPVRADADWEANTAPRTNSEAIKPPAHAARRTEIPDGAIADFNASRARREAANATLAELELEARRSTLISADQVRNEAFRAARAVRNTLQAIPARLSAQLAGENDAKKIFRILEDEIDDACRALSEKAASGAAN